MNKVDNKLIGLVVVFFLVFGFFTLNVAYQSSIGRQIRANNQQPPAAANSLLFVFPVTTQVGQNTTANCIARDAQGAGLNNVSASIQASCGGVNPASAQTNASGIASFMITSTQPCTAQLTCTLNGSTLVTQTASVQFNP